MSDDGDLLGAAAALVARGPHFRSRAARDHQQQMPHTNQLFLTKTHQKSVQRNSLLILFFVGIYFLRVKRKKKSTSIKSGV
jgi:hypothetical protein